MSTPGASHGFRIRPICRLALSALLAEGKQDGLKASQQKCARSPTFTARLLGIGRQRWRPQPNLQVKCDSFGGGHQLFWLIVYCDKR